MTWSPHQNVAALGIGMRSKQLLGMQHITKIPRKPEPVGAEIKDMCDGVSGIMLWLELMEGKLVMATKRFCWQSTKDGVCA
jgi:hypothetical protein